MRKPSIISLILFLGALFAFSSLNAQLDNGAYHIRSAVGGRYLDVQWGNANAGTPMHLWDFNGGVGQRWAIKKTPQGFYTIQSDLGRYLDVDNARADAGTKVHLWDYNGGVAQQWFFTPAGDGSYFIKSAVGTYLDVQNASPEAGTPIWMYPYNGSVAQRWYLEPLLKDKAVNRNLQVAAVKETDKTPGSIVAEIFDHNGKIQRETKSIRVRLFRNGAPYTNISPQHMGNGQVRLENIPAGTYTMQAYYMDGGGGSMGDGFSFSQEVLLSPDEQTVKVAAGLATRVVFRVK